MENLSFKGSENGLHINIKENFHHDKQDFVWVILTEYSIVYVDNMDRYTIYTSSVCHDAMCLRI